MVARLSGNEPTDATARLLHVITESSPERSVGKSNHNTNHCFGREKAITIPALWTWVAVDLKLPTSLLICLFRLLFTQDLNRWSRD